MGINAFPVIDLVATGNNIRRLRIERGLSVRDLQDYFGFEEPRAIYKWQKGECLPTVDNLYALGSLLETPMDQILVPLQLKCSTNQKLQQASACCIFLSSLFFMCKRRLRAGNVSPPRYREHGIAFPAAAVIPSLLRWYSLPGCFGYGRLQMQLQPFVSPVPDVSVSAQGTFPGRTVAEKSIDRREQRTIFRRHAGVDERIY